MVGVEWSELLANNSACYTEKPDMGIFMSEWKALYDSKSGERGIFSRDSAQKQAAKNGRRNADHKFGTNPCSEIILRDREFCNLSEVVVRESDTRETLLEKVRLATILGTIQSTLTNFKYVSAMWKKNCEEERLLGVSLTGIMDNELTNGKSGDVGKLLDELREEAVKTNKEYASKIGIPVASCNHLCQTIWNSISVSRCSPLVFTQDTIHFISELSEEIRKTH